MKANELQISNFLQYLLSFRFDVFLLTKVSVQIIRNLMTKV